MSDSSTFLAALQSFLAVVAGLFAIINPFSMMPLFLTLTANMSEEKRAAYAGRVSRNAALIMLVTLFLGGIILEFFGISLSALRIAGGLIVAFLGFNLIFPSPKGMVLPSEVSGVETDYSFMPLAFPGLTGAGTIAVIMSFSTKIAARPSWPEKITGHAVVVAAIFALTLIIYVLFRASTRLVRVLGAHGLEAMSRIMGLMLVCVGVELIGDGIKSFVQGA
jgi:multiple antibiotic resistance protein